MRLTPNQLERLTDALTDAERVWVYGSVNGTVFRCLGCGGEIEQGLAELGAIFCHDCRRPGR